jgi:hypothetical protein
VGNWGWLFSQVDALTMNYGDPFLEVGKGLYIALAVGILIIYTTKWAVTSEESIGGLLHFVSLLLVVGFILGNYNTSNPPPIGVGTPIKTLIPDSIANLADVIESTRYDEAMKRCSFIMDHLESPEIDMWHGAIDAHGLFAYVLVEVVMAILGAILMLPMMVGVIFLGIGALIWPLFIPWLIVPRMSWLFWNSLSYIIKYSFYPLFSVAITFVLSGVLVQMIDHALTLDKQTEIAGKVVQQYSLQQFTGMTLITFVAIIPMAIWSMKEMPNALRELFSGSAGAGSTFMREAGQAIQAFRKG